MKHVIDFIAGNPILLGVVIILLSFIAYAVVKRLAKIALFLLVLGLVTYFVLRWLGKV